MDVRPVKLISAFLGTWRIITSVREPATDPYSNQFSPVHTHQPILSGQGSASYDPSTTSSLQIISLLQVFLSQRFMNCD